MDTINKSINNIPIIRKGFYKDYVSNGVFGGFIAGIIFFLIMLANNRLLTSIITGFIIWMLIIISFGIGFITEEYFKRKKAIRKLFSDKYSFLLLNGFNIHEDLVFEGLYKEYFIRVMPKTQWQKKGKDIEYDLIETFYSIDMGNDTNDIKQRLSGDYYLGRLVFENNAVGFLPKDWETPDFKANLDNLINFLKKEGLNPISKDEWDKSTGNKLKEEQELEEKSRTRQILKIGKLDIKYIKRTKNEGH